MKLNILKVELIFQILLSLGSFIYLVIDYDKLNQASGFFIILFFIGVSNLLGFLIRISTVSSRFNRYYILGVILFFLSLYLLFSVNGDSNINFVMYFMGIGGLLFNIYYLFYGFYIIKKYSKQ